MHPDVAPCPQWLWDFFSTWGPRKKLVALTAAFTGCRLILSFSLTFISSKDLELHPCSSDHVTQSDSVLAILMFNDIFILRWLLSFSLRCTLSGGTVG